jgi:hypothetical protein
VDNDPAQEYEGSDDQFERHVNEMMKERKIGGKKTLQFPPPTP